MKTIYDVPIILRREIEALMVKPFIDAFEKELGHEKTYEIVKKVIFDIAFKDVLECQYVAMYERIGMKDLGAVLSCGRDEPFYKGMNSKIKMTRTRTLMQDGKCCDFVFDLEE